MTRHPLRILFLCTCLGVAAVVPAEDGRPLVVGSAERALLGIETALAVPATALVVDGLLGTVSLPIAGSTAVAAPYPGRVLQVLVEEGDSVSAGQVLAWVDSREVAAARSRVRELEVARDLARSVAFRDAGLLGEGVIPAVRAEASQAALAAREAELAGARAALQGLTADNGDITRYALMAPTAAVVMARHVAPGEPIEDLAVAFVLAAMDGLRLDIQVPREQAVQVAAGMVARVGTVVAKVSGRAAAIDPDTQAIQVRALLPPASGLLPGQRVMVSLELPAPAGAVEIPRAALVHSGASVQVYRAEEAGFSAVDVAVLGESAAAAVVSGALAAGDAVVIAGTSALRAMGR
ncbi:MAG: efflux RND transporter periplasmic adaptor subunit [Gammaproteobacteria bacterium]